MWDPGSEAAAWAGGTHEAGPGTCSRYIWWFLPARCEDFGVKSSCGVVGKKETKGGRRNGENVGRWSRGGVLERETRAESHAFRDRTSLRQNYQSVTISDRQLEIPNRSGIRKSAKRRAIHAVLVHR